MQQELVNALLGNLPSLLGNQAQIKEWSLYWVGGMMLLSLMVAVGVPALMGLAKAHTIRNNSPYRR